MSALHRLVVPCMYVLGLVGCDWGLGLGLGLGFGPVKEQGLVGC